MQWEIFNCPMGVNYCYSARRTKKTNLLLCYEGYSTRTTNN